MSLTHRLLITIFSFLLLGTLIWAWKHEAIIIRTPWTSRITTIKSPTSKQPVTLFYCTHDSWRSEIIDSLWSTEVADNLNYLINNWLALLDEEKIMPHKVSVQSVILSPSATEAYISFDRNPFHPEDSTYTKLMWVESLLKTIRGNNIPLQTVRLLVHHVPLYDPHLDMGISWPLNGFLEDIAPLGTPSTYEEPVISSTRTQKLYTIMINPAGDAQTVGRTLHDNYERGITLQWVQELKQQLESILPQVRIVLTRYAGEVVEPLQNANFANRLHADLYLSIHFYHEDENQPSLFVYQYVKDPTDIWPKTVSSVSFIPLDQIHLLASNATYHLRQQFINTLKKTHHLDLKNIACPFLPLKGITSPALGIEIGLHQKNDWKLYIQPIVNTITHLIKEKNDTF